MSDPILTLMMKGPDWVAEALMTDARAEDGWLHARLELYGADEKGTKAGLAFVMALLTGGRECVEREPPTVEYTREFDTGAMLHKGWARFSFKLKET